MEILSLGPRLHLVRPAFGQAYLWRDDDGVTLVDTGIPAANPPSPPRSTSWACAAPTCAAS
jgi:hypothetical protein